MPLAQSLAATVRTLPRKLEESEQSLSILINAFVVVVVVLLVLVVVERKKTLSFAGILLCLFAKQKV